MAESNGSENKSVGDDTEFDVHKFLEEMYEDPDLFDALAGLDLRYCWFDFKTNYAHVKKVMNDKKLRGQNPAEDLNIMVVLFIQNGNKISKWIRSKPKPLQQTIRTLKQAYNLKDETDNCHDLTLERVCYLFPRETSMIMRKTKHTLSDINVKMFVPHIDDAVMHQAFNLMVPKSLKKILDLTKVLNALCNKTIGKPETREKPLYELIDQCNNFVEKLFENEYCNEEERKLAMQKLGFCKVERFVPTRDFVAMIMEGSKLYEAIKTEKWTSLPSSDSAYKKYSKDELEEKITEFLNNFKDNQ